MDGAGAGPLNRSIELARGAWITILNDGDALRPDHASTLVAAAQAARAEVAFGRFEQHGSDGTRQVMGAFPPGDAPVRMAVRSSAPSYRAALPIRAHSSPVRRAGRLAADAPHAALWRPALDGRSDRLRLLPDTALERPIIRFQAPQIPAARAVERYFAMARKARWYSTEVPAMSY